MFATGEIIAILFFSGLFAVFIIGRFYRDKNVAPKHVTPESKAAFEAMLTDEGIFTYTKDGFTIALNKKHLTVNWPDIKAMFGYKVDVFAYDEICLDVFCNNDVSFRITEETAGWYVFLDKTEEHFPAIDKRWHYNIVQPPFATNFRLVYERNGLALNEAEELYYPK